MTIWRKTVPCKGNTEFLEVEACLHFSRDSKLTNVARIEEANRTGTDEVKLGTDHEKPS